MRRAIIPLTLGLVLILGDSVWASPTTTLQAFFATVNRVLEDPVTEDRTDARLGAILSAARGLFDDHGAARLSLGPEWDARTPAEQEEFAALFASLFERSFLTAFASRARAASSAKVAYLGESLDGATATVRTAVDARNGQDLTLDYRMIERDGRWIIRDVVLDGVSLTANYRAQFARVIQASSYGDLVAQMRAKAQDVPASPAVTAPRPSVARAAAESDVDPVAPSRALLSPPVAPAPIEPPRPSVTAPSIEQPRRTAPQHAALAMAPAPRARVYWVQVGAFKSAAAARRLKASLIERGVTRNERSRIVVDPGPSGRSLTRVRVGPFHDRGQASSTLRELETRGYQPFIVATP